MLNRMVLLLPILPFRTILILLSGSLLLLSSVDGFSEHLEAAEEENQFDDRTLLDMFGEGAKEFLTKQVVSNDQFRFSMDCCTTIDCNITTVSGSVHELILIHDDAFIFLV